MRVIRQEEEGPAEKNQGKDNKYKEFLMSNGAETSYVMLSSLIIRRSCVTLEKIMLMSGQGELRVCRAEQ